MEYARAYLGEYKVVKGNIQAKYCPFCDGGRHHDKYTFGLSIEKEVYKCHRGNCGVQGHFSELLKEKNIEYKNENKSKEYKKTTVKKDYKIPQPIGKKLSQKAIDYAKLRGISEDTLNHFNVEQKNNNFAFNFYNELGELITIKYRPIGKLSKGQQKAFREKDTMPILYNLNNIDKKQDVVITEGEFDAMAVYEAGYHNVVSVPSGCKDFTWVDTCWEWIESFEGNFIIYGDNDQPGREMIRELITKLGDYRIKIVKHNHKDANEELHKEGKETVLKNVLNADFSYKEGILEVADIDDTGEEEGIPSGFLNLDKTIDDFKLGELTVWTGKNASGKSTILGQVILEAVENNYPTFVYSGELTSKRFKRWIDLQAAGTGFIKEHLTKYGEVEYRVTPEASRRISKWYRNKLYLYDNNVREKNIESTTIIDMCKFAAKRYNCKLFVVDNLMTSDFDTSGGKDYYQAQSDFIGKLVNFAKTFNVHVHLVAHPRKTHGLVTKDSIGGSGDITNRADNVIAVERFKDDTEGEELLGDDFVSGSSGCLNLLKNRSNGKLAAFLLKYDPVTRRMRVVEQDGDVVWRDEYSWRKTDDMTIDDIDDDCPF